MGLFNVNAPLYADLDLVLQVSILILLLAGIAVAKLRRKFNRHGAVMGIALALNTISIIVVMLPSFLSFRGLFANLSTPAAIVITHAVLGVLVEALGIWLVVNWIGRSGNIKRCVGKRNLMRVTLLLWFLELIIGIYVYVMLYIPI